MQWTMSKPLNLNTMFKLRGITEIMNKNYFGRTVLIETTPKAVP